MRSKRVALSGFFLVFGIQAMDNKELSSRKVIAYQRALEAEIIKTTEESAAIDVLLYQTKDNNRLLSRQQLLEEKLLQQVKLESIEAGFMRTIIALASDCGGDESVVEVAFRKEIGLLLNGTEDTAEWLGLNEYKQ